MQYLGLIPARRGSKRIPCKNIKPSCGELLLAYTIEAGIVLSCIDPIIVSNEEEPDE